MSAPYGLDIDTDQFVDTFNADFYDPSPWDYIPQANFTPMDAMPMPAPAMGAPVISLTSLAMPAPGTLSHTTNHITRGHYFQPEATMAPSMSTPTASLVSLAMPALDATAHTMGHIASSIPPLMPALGMTAHTVNDIAGGHHFQPEATNQVQTIVLLMPEPDSTDHPLHFCVCHEFFFPALVLSRVELL